MMVIKGADFYGTIKVDGASKYIKEVSNTDSRQVSFDNVWLNYASEIGIQVRDKDQYHPLANDPDPYETAFDESVTFNGKDIFIQSDRAWINIEFIAK